jgi:uncharacterized protein (DUF1330 family)
MVAVIPTSARVDTLSPKVPHANLHRPPTPQKSPVIFPRHGSGVLSNSNKVLGNENAGSMAVFQFESTENEDQKIQSAHYHRLAAKDQEAKGDEVMVRQGAVAVSERNTRRALQYSFKGWRHGVQQPLRRSAIRLNAGIPNNESLPSFPNLSTLRTPPASGNYTLGWGIESVNRSRSSSPRGWGHHSRGGSNTPIVSPVRITEGRWKGGGGRRTETQSLRGEMLFEQEQMTEVHTQTCVCAYCT